MILKGRKSENTRGELNLYDSEHGLSDQGERLYFFKDTKRSLSEHNPDNEQRKLNEGKRSEQINRAEELKKN